MNKKIVNATPTQCDGIEFKSTSEKSIYRALIRLGITPTYEGVTYTLSPKLRPSVPFYVRTKSTKSFDLNMKPLDSVTYTPDFTFTLNGIFVIIEVKGFSNDVYPVKKNLFRKYLETLIDPVMFFEVKTVKELLKAIDIVKKETNKIQELRKLIVKLPDADIPTANKALESRDFKKLEHLVSLVLKRIEEKPENYQSLDLNSIYLLQSKIIEITIHEELN